MLLFAPLTISQRRCRRISFLLQCGTPKPLALTE
jgi:hypothetical protein